MAFQWRRQPSKGSGPGTSDHHTGGGRPGSSHSAPRTETGRSDSKSSSSRSCKCEGAPDAIQKQSSTAANPGRFFWVCAKPRGEQCRFFEWDDVPPREAPSRIISAEEPEKKRPRSVPSYSFKLASIDRLSTAIPSSCFSIERLEDLRNWRGVSVKDGATDLFDNKVINIEVDVDALKDTLDRLQSFDIRAGCDLPGATLRHLVDFCRKEKLRMNSEKRFAQPLDEVLPAGMCEKLMTFQWEGIHFALEREGRCLIGDDMGLGKTLQAIAVARLYRDDWPLLIICPSSLRLNWKEELLKWLGEDIYEEDINVIMKGSDCQRRLELVNIVSYELVQKITEPGLRRCEFIVADESHYLKSRDSKRTKFVAPLIAKAKRALLLSGTPALSRPIELFPQVSALEPVLFPDYREFAERYCNAHVSRWGWDVSGSSCLDELHTILSGSCLIRRKKCEVLTQLPAKQRGVVWVETKSSVMKDVAKAQREYETAMSASNSARDDDAESCRNAMRAAMNKLYSLTGQAKLDAVQQFLKDTLESTSKVIIFCHHQEVLMRVNEFLHKLKIETIVIDGRTPQMSRQELCSKFQSEQACRAAVLSITAAGVGLTLTAASVVVFAELYWNPGSLLQAEDRAHRIGQKDSVLVQYLLARGTLDESMWQTVCKKLIVVGKSLTGAAVPLSVEEDEKQGHGPMDQFTELPSSAGRTARQGRGTVVLDIDDEAEPVDSRVESVLRRGASSDRERALTRETSHDSLNVFPVDAGPSGALDDGVAYVDADMEQIRRLQFESGEK